MKRHPAYRRLYRKAAGRGNLLADANMDHGALAKAGEELENVEHAIDENEIITRMRQTNEAFTQMMKKVNSIIKFVVTGENDEEEHGCNGSCEGLQRLRPPALMLRRGRP